MSVGVEKVGLVLGDRTGRWTAPDWTFRPAGTPCQVPAPLPRVAPRPAPGVSEGTGGSARVPVGTCDCGGKLDALLKVLSLPEDLRGLVLALAAAPGADALGVLADYLEERMDPRSGRFRKLARRARKAGPG